MAFYFNYTGHRCNCWLKIVNHWDKRDNSVMCAGKKIKSGFKISSKGDRHSDAYMQAPFKKKPEQWDINIVLL